MKKAQVLLVIAGLAVFFQPTAYSAQEKDYVPPALTPLPYLIRDPAVRKELKLTAEQTARLDALCNRMDAHLFVLRDQPPNPTEPEMIEHVRAVVELMKETDDILQPPQRLRLQELGFQFEGVYAMFRPAPAAYLRLTEEQKNRMQTLHRQFLRNQEQLRTRLEESGRQNELQEQMEQLRVRFMNQFLRVLSEGQVVIWNEMLGAPFDFSQTQPLSFQAPELEGLTGWFNGKPLTFKQLSGRVVIVIFCSPEQSSAEDLAAYKLWARQYDPQDVALIGILVPPLQAQKDGIEPASWVQKEGLTFPVALDAKRLTVRAWANPVLPSLYLVDKKGRVRWWWYGPLQQNNASGGKWVAERIEILRSEQASQ
ncbi:MAG TPA: redoxin domain-containing protein [Anaerohalosphaeraceae bacterium]|nr:redoxin domain-containing protein [Anaerohalosphaeraceae bacterium]